MTARFVRLHPIGNTSGHRLRLELDPGDGIAELVDEHVHPEHVLNADAYHRERGPRGRIMLTDEEVDWLHFALYELIAQREG
ncbi:MAG TPA: hypothetical protein VJU58_13800 [Microbacterium sp.]|nr:hypothetical protein [Microbacterium sp.]